MYVPIVVVSTAPLWLMVHEFSASLQFTHGSVYVVQRCIDCDDAQLRIIFGLFVSTLLTVWLMVFVFPELSTRLTLRVPFDVMVCVNVVSSTLVHPVGVSIGSLVVSVSTVPVFVHPDVTDDVIFPVASILSTSISFFTPMLN